VPGAGPHVNPLKIGTCRIFSISRGTLHGLRIQKTIHHGVQRPKAIEKRSPLATAGQTGRFQIARTKRPPAYM